MPVIIARGLTMLPEMTVSFRYQPQEKSIAAWAEKAMVSAIRESAWWPRRTRRSSGSDSEQLYHIGTVSYIKQLVKMPGEALSA